MYLWSSEKGEYELLQKLQTDGAHAAELFEVDGRVFLCVANFGDRQNKRYESRSTIWEFTEEEELNDTSQDCSSGIDGEGGSCSSTSFYTSAAKGSFKMIDSVDSYGATDCVSVFMLSFISPLLLSIMIWLFFNDMAFFLNMMSNVSIYLYYLLRNTSR